MDTNKRQALRTKVVRTLLLSCSECGHFADEDVDVYHGCNWYPATCGLANRKFEPGEDRTGIPAWCPLT